ncbi:MAG: hypothetical protein Q4C49_11235 [Bacillota bacterium]|nr:hypothetical protein [Bacillota bacterium]
MKKRIVLKAFFIGSLSLNSLVGCKKVNLDNVSQEALEENVYQLTVDELFQKGESILDKKVEVTGYIPSDIDYDESGNMIVTLYNMDQTEAILLTGEFPPAFHCLATVSGIVCKLDGKIVLEATDYDILEQYVQEVPEYDPSENMGATVYGPPEYFFD